MYTFETLLTAMCDDSTYVHNIGEMWPSGTPTIVGDWNERDPKKAKRLRRFIEIAKEKGYEVVYYDEVVDDCNGRLYNTNPTHWGWVPDFMEIDGEIYGRDHLQGDYKDEYVEYLVDNMHVADKWDTDFSSHGFEKVEDDCWENGWYHREDDPAEVWKTLQETHGPCEVIFATTDIGQFHVNFTAWVRKTPYHAADEAAS